MRTLPNGGDGFAPANSRIAATLRRLAFESGYSQPEILHRALALFEAEFVARHAGHRLAVITQSRYVLTVLENPSLPAPTRLHAPSGSPIDVDE